MPSPIASRTPEGEPNCCPVCRSEIAIEPSIPPGDAPCPRCGHLLWFLPRGGVIPVLDTGAIASENRRRANAFLDQSSWAGSISQQLGADSLDLMELVMELEEELGIRIPDDQLKRIQTVDDLLDWYLTKSLT